jgi:hypothetical protein
MGQKWAAAPTWLKVLCIVGVPWFLAGLPIGAPRGENVIEQGALRTTPLQGRG